MQLSCLESGNFADDCDRESTCQFKSIWADVDRAIGSVLNSITFANLVQQVRARERQVMYHI